MYVFIADIHIRPEIKSDRKKFINWINNIRSKEKKIYILGDLFEYWYTGIEEELSDVIETLADPDVFVLPGNRDFLITHYRNKNINIIYKEESILDVYGQKVLIAHGHTLTEGDTGFKMLHMLGWPVLRLFDRILPLKIKLSCAKTLVNSSALVRPPSADIPKDIALKKGVDKVICGHLHKGFLGDKLIVLPSFLDEMSWLEWDEAGPRFVKNTSSAI
jgi:UDP-2,3-diacylglucosamine pyrophosphatase LpxH